MRCTSMVSVLLTLTTAPGLLHAGSMETDSIEHAAPFFAERLPLGIDGEKLGVFIDGLNAPAAAAILVDDLGIVESDIQPSTVPGWFYIDVSSSAFFADRPLLDCLDDLLHLDLLVHLDIDFLANDIHFHVDILVHRIGKLVTFLELVGQSFASLDRCTASHKHQQHYELQIAFHHSNHLSKKFKSYESSQEDCFPVVTTAKKIKYLLEHLNL